MAVCFSMPILQDVLGQACRTGDRLARFIFAIYARPPSSSINQGQSEHVNSVCRWCVVIFVFDYRVTKKDGVFRVDEGEVLSTIKLSVRRPVFLSFPRYFSEFRDVHRLGLCRMTYHRVMVISTGLVHLERRRCCSTVDEVWRWIKP